ncbi:MAG: soluble lytic murein transglycosylase [Kiritimatiellia bacterium]|jgi:soluble lytic murein transglycosylase
MATVSKKTTTLVISINLCAAALIIGLSVSTAVRHSHRYDELILDMARSRDLDPRLISALVWKESRYDHQAVGKAGEIGLMQVMEAAAQDWAKAEKVEGFELNFLYDPKTNLMVGTWYLAKAIDDWKEKKDPVPYALAQYNAGRSRVLKWDQALAESSEKVAFVEGIGFPGTRKYVEDIMGKYR